MECTILIKVYQPNSKSTDRLPGKGEKKSLCFGVLLVFVHVPVVPTDLKLLIKKTTPNKAFPAVRTLEVPLPHLFPPVSQDQPS